MRLTFSDRTDPGLVRANNQDACSFDRLELPEGGALLVVADGMGGYDGGEVASRMAVDTVRSHVLADAAAWKDAAPVAHGLLDAIHEANRAILDAQLANPALASMGTTLTAVVVYGERVFVGHVGDSKAYLISDGRAVQITSDHNVPGELVQNGHLTAEEAAVHPQRHILTRALGVREELLVEELELRWKPGDMLLLCTDGLSNLVSLGEVEALANELEPEALADRLVDLANSRGGHDNITVLAVRWEG